MPNLEVQADATNAQAVQADNDQDLLALTVQPLAFEEIDQINEGIEPVASIMSVIALTWAT